MTREVVCAHFETVTAVRPRSEVCEACVAAGDSYTAARFCAACGFVGCCDGSKNHHMVSHFEATGHPIVRPVGPPPGKDWMWCYLDETYVTA